MSWNFKKSNKLNVNSKKTCTVDEVLDTISNKYKSININELSSIVNDVLIKHLTEHKISLSEIKEKYSKIGNINDIVNDILKLAEEKNKS